MTKSDERDALRAEIERMRAELAEWTALAKRDFELRAIQRDERDALREAVDRMVTRISAAPVAIMDTRDALGL